MNWLAFVVVVVVFFIFFSSLLNGIVRSNWRTETAKFKHQEMNFLFNVELKALDLRKFESIVKLIERVYSHRKHKHTNVNHCDKYWNQS